PGGDIYCVTRAGSVDCSLNGAEAATRSTGIDAERRSRGFSGDRRFWSYDGQTHERNGGRQYYDATPIVWFVMLSIWVREPIVRVVSDRRITVHLCSLLAEVLSYG